MQASLRHLHKQHLCCNCFSSHCRLAVTTTTSMRSRKESSQLSRREVGLTMWRRTVGSILLRLTRIASESTWAGFAELHQKELRTEREAEVRRVTVDPLWFTLASVGISHCNTNISVRLTACSAHSQIICDLLHTNIRDLVASSPEMRMSKKRESYPPRPPLCPSLWLHFFIPLVIHSFLVPFF